MEYARKFAIQNCRRCVELDMMCVESCRDNTYTGRGEHDKWLNKFIDHYRYEEAIDYVGDPPHTPVPRPGTHKGNGKPKGLFAFTLTFSPNDGFNEHDLRYAAEKIMSQRTCPVKRYCWYLETKEDGRHPHIHGVYETDNGGKIHAKVWRRYWKIWGEGKKEDRLGDGFRGGYHKSVDSAIAYKEYIEKDDGTHVTFGDWTDVGQLN